MQRSSRRRNVTPVVLGAVALLFTGLGAFGPRPAVSSTSAPVLLAAGDIDGCAQGVATGKIVAGIDGAVAVLGDNAYPSGSASDYRQCYDPAWGKVKDRTHPVPGNHDYDTPHAAGYFGYFGAAAGPAARGYYSYDVDTWHVVALNSNCSDVDCNAERTWLDADLSAHPAACTVAYWHHPRFSSGSAGNNASLNTFWTVLYDHRASIVLSGHDHDYERFAPQNPSGRRDPGRGIRQFIVGTGGGPPGSFFATDPNSEVRNNHTFGVLQLTLRPGGYDWKFLPTAGGGFTDSGSDVCSGTAPATTTTAPAATPAVDEPAPPPSSTGPAMGEPAAPPQSDPPGGADRPVASGPPSSGRPDTSRPAPRRSSSTTPLPTSTAVAPARTTAPPGTVPPYIPSSETVSPGSASLSDLVAGDPGSGLPAAADPGQAPAAADTDAPLLAAISRLTQSGSIPGRPDRRPVTFIAIALLVLNGAALSAINRKGIQLGR